METRLCSDHSHTLCSITVQHLPQNPHANFSTSDMYTYHASMNTYVGTYSTKCLLNSLYRGIRMVLPMQYLIDLYVEKRTSSSGRSGKLVSPSLN